MQRTAPILSGVGIHDLVLLADAPALAGFAPVAIVVEDSAFVPVGDVNFRTFWDTTPELPASPVSDSTVNQTVPEDWPGTDEDGRSLGGNLKAEILAGSTGTLNCYVKYYYVMWNADKRSRITTRQSSVNSVIGLAP